MDFGDFGVEACPEIYLASLSCARGRPSKGGARPSARGGRGLGLGEFPKHSARGPRRTGIAAAIPKPSRQKENCLDNSETIGASWELSRQYLGNGWSLETS